METTIIHEIVSSCAIGQIMSHDVLLLLISILNVDLNSFVQLDRVEKIFGTSGCKTGFSKKPGSQDCVVSENVSISQY